MTAPANIRVNTQVPFPSLVLAGAPVTTAKANGVWTVGFSIANLAVQVPPTVNQPNDYLLVWDSVAQTFFRISLSAMQARTQRSVTANGNLPITATDQIININAAGDLAPAIPLAALRNGLPLTVINLPGSHAQTLTASGADGFDGAPDYLLEGGGVVTFLPYNDGVNNALGYKVT